MRIFLSKEENAKHHLENICPYCPEEKKRTRYVDGVDECWWKYNWERGNFDIPRNFGFWNYVRFYMGQETRLDRFLENYGAD